MDFIANVHAKFYHGAERQSFAVLPSIMLLNELKYNTVIFTFLFKVMKDARTATKALLSIPCCGNKAQNAGKKLN